MEVYIPFNYKYNFTEFTTFENYIGDTIRKQLDVRVEFNNSNIDPMDKFLEISTAVTTKGLRGYTTV